MGDSRLLFEEAHALIKKAWTEDHFSFEGKFRQVRNITVIPKPVQKLPPFYVACIFTEESFAWAGAQGHNLMTVPYAAPTAKFINGRIATYQDARRAAGFTTPGEILGVYHFYCAQTSEQAIADTRGPMMRYVQSVIDSNEEAAYSNQYQAYKSLSEAFRGVTYETLYPHKVVIGDPAQCAAADRGDPCIGGLPTSVCWPISVALASRRSWVRWIALRAKSCREFEESRAVGSRAEDGC